MYEYTLNQDVSCLYIVRRKCFDHKWKGSGVAMALPGGQVKFEENQEKLIEI